MVIGKLLQIRSAVELNARPTNTVLSVGWDSSWWSDVDYWADLDIIRHIRPNRGLTSQRIMDSSAI